MKLYLTIGLFILSTALILLDHFTNFEINHYSVYGFMLVVVISSLALLVSNFKIKFKTYLLIMIGTIGVLWYVKFFFTWGGNWCTQTVVFQNLHLKNRTIEYQMVDEGAFGYGRRTIDRIKLIPFFDWTKEIKESEIDTLEWERVNLEVNELGLKEI